MLPKINYPVFTLNLPISNKRITFRPMLVKEEKILMLAKEGNSEVEIVENIKTIIQNCVKEEIDFDDLPLVEAEFIFLNLRSKSINNIVPVTISDPHDPSIRHKVDIDLDQVTITSNNKSRVIDLQDGIGIKLKYPTLNTLKNVDRRKTIEVVNLTALRDCIDCVFDSENVYKFRDTPIEEANQFLDSLQAKHIEMISDFFDNLPKLNLKIDFVDSKGQDATRTLETFYDFFQ